jgi:hypothetical protein
MNAVIDTIELESQPDTQLSYTARVRAARCAQRIAAGWLAIDMQLAAQGRRRLERSQDGSLPAGHTEADAREWQAHEMASTLRDLAVDCGRELRQVGFCLEARRQFLELIEARCQGRGGERYFDELAAAAAGGI